VVDGGLGLFVEGHWHLGVVELVLVPFLSECITIVDETLSGVDVDG